MLLCTIQEFYFELLAQYNCLALLNLFVVRVKHGQSYVSVRRVIESSWMCLKMLSIFIVRQLEHNFYSVILNS